MVRKLRYGLIAAGFICFAILAPILVMYIQGRLFSFSDNRTQATGLISIKTNPSSATIALDGKTLKDKTPSALRFLKAADYSLIVSKPGYRTWQKRLSVMENKVTLANPEPDKQILLLDAPATLLSKDVSNFITQSNSIYLIKNLDSQLKTLNEKGEELASLDLPEIPSQLYPDPNSTQLLLQNSNSTLAYNYKDGSLLTLPEVFSEKSELTHNSKQLLFLQDTSLFLVNVDLPKTKILLATNVLTYKLNGDYVYFLKKSPTSSELWYGQLTSNNITTLQALATNLPTLVQPKLLIDESRAIFILDSGELFRINEKLEKIASGVIFANCDGGTLVYHLPGELWWYESSANRTHVISRSSDNYTAIYFDPRLQYAIFTTPSELVALEINSNGGQNRYVLDKGSIPRFLLQNKALVYLKDNNLLQLPLFP